MKFGIRFAVGLFALTCVVPLIAANAPVAVAPTPSQSHVHYLADGRAGVPEDYRDWPFLSSGLNMNYSDPAPTPDHAMFDNVFVSPESLRAFRTTGTWPDGTVFVKEDRMGSTKGSINKSGQFQSENIMAMEMHIKDAARFKGGWAFFISGDSGPLAVLPESASCYSCHGSHGAVDTTFVQFYPSILDVARRKGTLSAGYRHDEGAAH